MDAIAAITREPNAPFSIETVQIAQPSAGEVLVRIRAVGICHTDIVFMSGAMGSPFPIVLGHEGAGVVEAVGAGVTKVAAGDKVLLTFDSCGHCATCDTHDPAYCQNFVPLNFAGVYGDGSSPLSQNGSAISGRFFGQSSFANFAIATSRNVIKLPPEADLTVLAPLGCGVQTGVGAVMRSLAAAPGSSLVVIGGGAVGLSAVIGGVLAGCAEIILIEPQAERRALGLAVGAHHAINPTDGDTSAAVRNILPHGANNIIDTSGNAGALQAAIGMLAQKGKLGLIGVPGALDTALAVPIVPALTIGFSVLGICEGDSDPDEFLPQLVEYFAAGRLPIDKFTKIYPFNQINEAVADAHNGKCVKAVLVFDK